MLNTLKTTKNQLMKDRHDTKERLMSISVNSNHIDTAKQDIELKHKLTLQINGINEVLTEMKNFAVKNKLATENLLTTEQQVTVLELVNKRLDKEIKAYGPEHSKTIDAKLTKDFLLTFIPEEFKKASAEEMDEFVKDAKQKGFDFKTIMSKAKENKNFDMKYISTIARN